MFCGSYASVIARLGNYVAGRGISHAFFALNATQCVKKLETKHNNTSFYLLKVWVSVLMSDS